MTSLREEGPGKNCCNMPMMAHFCQATNLHVGLSNKSSAYASELEVTFFDFYLF
jgi:hypothetical protein